MDKHQNPSMEMFKHTTESAQQESNRKSSASRLNSAIILPFKWSSDASSAWWYILLQGFMLEMHFRTEFGQEQWKPCTYLAVPLHQEFVRAKYSTQQYIELLLNPFVLLLFVMAWVSTILKYTFEILVMIKMKNIVQKL